MNNEDKYGLVPDLDWININSLTIDDTYQRDTLSKRSQQNIKKIKEAFAWSKFSPLTVADLGNNKYSIIDGQHRYIAAKELGDITDLPCWIIPQCQTKSQADAFIDINKNRVYVNNWQMYKAKLAANDENATRINEFLNTVNITVPFNGYCSKPNMTLAIACIGKHLQQHNDAYLSEVIADILKAYPNKIGQLKRDLIDTLVLFKIRNGAKIKDEIIIKTLQAFDNADRITGKAAELRAVDTSLKAGEAHYKVFLNKYKEVKNV